MLPTREDIEYWLIEPGNLPGEVYRILQAYVDEVLVVVVNDPLDPPPKLNDWSAGA